MRMKVKVGAKERGSGRESGGGRERVHGPRGGV